MTSAQIPLRRLCPSFDWVIGFTGGIASGKSNACNVLASLGAVCVDADKVAHKVYLPGRPAYNKLIEEFGKDIVSSTGEISRPALGKLVFGNAVRLQRLNSIVWPHLPELIVTEFETLLKQREARPDVATVGVIEAAALIEAGWMSVVDEVWCTYVPRPVAIERIVERNGLSVAEAEARLDSQLKAEDRFPHCTVCVDTSGPKTATHAMLTQHWNALQQRLKGPTAIAPKT